MRKIYSLVLLAVGLLIGTNAWADGLIENVRTGVQYDHLKDAFAAAQDGDVLELTGNMNESQTDGAAWLGEATSGTLSNYASTDRSITLDLKGHLYNFTGSAEYKIVLTRGVLRIKSTGGEGEITSNKSGITVYGTYLKIDAKENTPFAHLIIEENVKITCEAKGVVLNSPLRPESTSEWGWAKADYPVNYCCEIFKDSQWGISNGARIDIHGKVYAKKYACQVGGNIRTPREYLNADGTYNTAMGAFPYYLENTETGELYLPGTTKTGKTQYANTTANAVTCKSSGGTWWSDNEFSSSNDLVLTLDDDNYSSYIHVYNTAVLKTDNQDKNDAVGLYSSGFARCYIEGTCEGSTGAWIKGGEVEFHDATVISNWESDYAAATNDGKPSGVAGGGSAIVIESKKGWTGNISVTISGDTHVSTDHGYAIDEQVTVGGTNVNYLTITGGTFEGGDVPVYTANPDKPTGYDTTYVQGTMHVSQPTLDAHHNPDTITTITILGAEVQGDAHIGEGENQTTLEDFLNGSDSHITYVEDEDGNTTMIVSQGDKPETYEDLDDPTAPTPWSWCADAAQSGHNVAWTKIEDDAEIASGTVILGELQINSGSLLAGNQQLTIHDGATLQVERLIMNGYARIIVEAGGKLIVTGTQGISAPSINNILLKNEENKPAIFLFHPKVSSNRHPNGTVEFTSKGYNKGGSDYAWQKFGVPTQTGELSEISIENNVATAFGKFNYEATTPAWEVIGYLNHAPALALGDLDQAFEYYQMEHNTATVGTKVTFKGKLVGNDCPAPVIRPNFWNGYANSYSAPIDGAALLAQIPAPADKAFYLYELDVLTDKFSWVAQSNLHLSNIQPMQPFLLRNPSADSAALALNYEAAVYTPATSNNAPVRSVAKNMTKVEFIVRGEAGVDHVIVAQDDEFSAAFDNGYDVTKYMNDDVNMYVTADEKMAIFATDNLENTYVGLSTVKGGNYTITFANVQGEELTLIDHETGAQVAMVEGNTYAFTAAANATNDYRFEVVGAAKLPTAIENTEAVKSAKGIYTITGQYLGEMNVWNSLPAGVYVIDGAKRVK